jgi:hypothetical protein
VEMWKTPSGVVAFGSSKPSDSSTDQIASTVETVHTVREDEDRWVGLRRRFAVRWLGVAATPSIKVIKQFGFKGSTRRWSNRYHFNGGTPADSAHWTTFSDAVVAAEKVALSGNVTIVETIGYEAGSDVPVFSKTYSQAGTGSFAGTITYTPGQTAALLRWSTTARTSKNHPIYLFNYYHGVLVKSSSAPFDELSADQKSAIDTYAGAWISGFSDGTHTLVRAGPNGATATGHQCEKYVTHRDFPYTASV